MSYVKLITPYNICIRTVLTVHARIKTAFYIVSTDLSLYSRAFRATAAIIRVSTDRYTHNIYYVCCIPHRRHVLLHRTSTLARSDFHLASPMALGHFLPHQLKFFIYIGIYKRVCFRILFYYFYLFFFFIAVDKSRGWTRKKTFKNYSGRFITVVRAHKLVKK